MRSSTATAWSNAATGRAIVRAARHCRKGWLPNDLWCADFKREFKLGNGRYCFPSTVRDHASRFLLLCEALESPREDPAITAFERLLRVENRANGGESVSQLPLKDKAFSTFLDQNPPFELRPKWESLCGKKPVSSEDSTLGTETE